MRVWAPLLIAAQPSAWAWVGAAKELSNQARTAGENGANGSCDGASPGGSLGAIVMVATGLASIGAAVDFDQAFEIDEPRCGRYGDQSVG